MKVKQNILVFIDTPQVRTAIAMHLMVGEQTVALHMRENKANGRMTKMDFLQAISKVSGTPIDEILEPTAAVMKEPQS